MEDNIIKYLENIIGVSFYKEEARLLETFTREKRMKKGSIPVVAGRSLSYLYVIMKGLVRGFYIDENGCEITKCFSSEGGFFAAEGLVSRHSASFGIECLEDVICLQIPYVTIDTLKSNNHKICEAFYAILQKEFIKSEQRTRDILMEDASSRYQKFLNDYPQLAIRVKQKYIASYIGISPVTLSRLKKIHK